MSRRLSVGSRRFSPQRTVSEADIVQFAALSRDFSRLHTDAAYAAHSVFGKRVSHGLLGLSLAEGLLAQSGSCTGMVGAWVWEFLGPFFAGDTLSAEAEVVSVESFAGSLLAVEDVIVRKQGEAIQRGRHALAIAPESGIADWLGRLLTARFPDFDRQVVEEGGPPPSSTAESSALMETGIFFEDLRNGDRFTTPAMTIGDYDIAAFLGLIGDVAPWWHDRTLTRRVGLRGMPVPPLFGLTLVEGLKYALAPDRGVGIPMASLSWRWSHRAPLFAGDTVRVEATIDGRRASRTKTDRGVIAQALDLCNEHGSVAQHGQHLQMFRRRPPLA